MFNFKILNMKYKLKNGGTVKLQTAWRTIPKREQKRNDKVTKELIDEFNQQQSGVSTNGGFAHRVETPLIDEHPGLDIALITAQPGNILTKLMAPSAYKGLVQDITNGEGSYALMSGTIPIKSFPWSRTVTKYQKEWPHWRRSIEKSELQIKGSYTSNANRARESGFNRYSRTRIYRPEKATKVLTLDEWNDYTKRAKDAHNWLRDWELTKKGEPIPQKVQDFLDWRKSFYKEHPDIFSLLNKGGNIK